MRRYEAPYSWRPPTEQRIVVFEPGMRLPEPWYAERYRIAPDPYGLPPPPPRHAWVQVDDDVVLIALASGLVADFVYDLFE
jgi:Ni/Co efflux regulator RcnB